MVVQNGVDTDASIWLRRASKMREQTVAFPQFPGGLPPLWCRGDLGFSPNTPKGVRTAVMLNTRGSSGTERRTRTACLSFRINASAKARVFMGRVAVRSASKLAVWRLSSPRFGAQGTKPPLLRWPQMKPSHSRLLQDASTAFASGEAKAPSSSPLMRRARSFRLPVAQTPWGARWSSRQIGRAHV